jgi:hypothetical protein
MTSYDVIATHLLIGQDPFGRIDAEVIGRGLHRPALHHAPKERVADILLVNKDSVKKALGKATGKG